MKVWYVALYGVLSFFSCVVAIDLPEGVQPCKLIEAAKNEIEGKLKDLDMVSHLGDKVHDFKKDLPGFQQKIKEGQDLFSSLDIKLNGAQESLKSIQQEQIAPHQDIVDLFLSSDDINTLINTSDASIDGLREDIRAIQRDLIGVQGRLALINPWIALVDSVLQGRNKLADVYGSLVEDMMPNLCSSPKDLLEKPLEIASDVTKAVAQTIGTGADTAQVTAVAGKQVAVGVVDIGKSAVQAVSHPADTAKKAGKKLRHIFG